MNLTVDDVEERETKRTERLVRVAENGVWGNKVQTPTHEAGMRQVSVCQCFLHTSTHFERLQGLELDLAVTAVTITQFGLMLVVV